MNKPAITESEIIMNPIQPHSHDSDLEWRAWCYLAGELSEQETRDFEALLQDPAHCHVLAELLDLQAALLDSPAATPAVPARLQPMVSRPAQTHTPPSRWSSIVVFFATAAACWFVFLGSWNSDSDTHLAQRRAQSQQLTELWLNPDADDLLSADMSDVNNDDIVDNEVPGWLMAAVTPLDPETDSLE